MKHFRQIMLTTLIFWATQGWADKINHLLQAIEKNSDLSKKTRIESGGIYEIYTADQLRRMQIKRLGNLMRYLIPFPYAENRFGYNDPFYRGGFVPFSSSLIRLYIDDQEIVGGLYGSGLFTHGNMTLDWVDHVEIYKGSTLYSYASEPTLIVIRLYSKRAIRDGGNKIITRLDSRGSWYTGAYRSTQDNDRNDYFFYTGLWDWKRQPHHSRGVKLHKDQQGVHLVSAIHQQSTDFLIDYHRVDRQGFGDFSLDMTPDRSEHQNEALHIGLDGHQNGWFYALASDFFHNQTDFLDQNVQVVTGSLFPIRSFQSKSRSNSLSATLKRSIRWKKHHLTIGINTRSKKYRYGHLQGNGVAIKKRKNNRQSLYHLFAEDHFAWQENAVLTAGVSAFRVLNNHSVQKDTLINARLSQTYTLAHWTFKAIYSHLEKSIDPYLIETNHFFIVPGYKKPEQNDMYIGSIRYDGKSSTIDLRSSYLCSKNRLMNIGEGGLLDNYPKGIVSRNILIDWIYHYDPLNTIKIKGSYSSLLGIPLIGDLDRYFCILSQLHSHGAWDFYQGLFYYSDNRLQSDHYDYNMALLYHYHKDLTIGLKGINLFNHAMRISYMRFDPNTHQSLSPLEVSATDRRIFLSIEYTF